MTLAKFDDDRAKKAGEVLKLAYAEGLGVRAIARRLRMSVASGVGGYQMQRHQRCPGTHPLAEKERHRCRRKRKAPFATCPPGAPWRSLTTPIHQDAPSSTDERNRVVLAELSGSVSITMVGTMG